MLSDMSKEKKKPRDVRERTERTELFKQVALIQLQTRAAAVVRGSADGPVVCHHFLNDVALVTEGILNAAKTFGEEK
jgi:hypothetical protein